MARHRNAQVLIRKIGISIMSELNQDRSLNSSDQISYRYRTLGYSGECRITETHVESKIRNWHRRWEQSVPLILVSAHVTRLTHIPDSYWWTSIVCGAGLGIGIWGVISPEQTGLSRVVAMPVILVCALLLVYLLKFRRVVWCIFTTAIPNTTIAFCRNATPDSAFEAFTEKLQSVAAFKYPPETPPHQES